MAPLPPLAGNCGAARPGLPIGVFSGPSTIYAIPSISLLLHAEGYLPLLMHALVYFRARRCSTRSMADAEVLEITV